MTIYSYICDNCEHTEEQYGSIHRVPPWTQVCPVCKHHALRRDLLADRTQISTVGCSGGSDPDDIPPEYRVTDTPLEGTSAAKGAKMERLYQKDIEAKRRAKRKGAPMEMTNSIPAELYHGKIRQTGDKNYWDDPKNRKRHKSTEV